MLTRGARAQVAAQGFASFAQKDATAHAGVPAHRVTDFGVGMQVAAPERLGPRLQGQFDHLDPEEHAPGRHLGHLHDLVLVIPMAQVRIDHPAICRLQVERRPFMRRRVDRHDLIGVVAPQLPQKLPVVAIPLLGEAHGKGAQADHAVFAQQLDRLLILAAGAALAHSFKRRLAGALEPQQETANAPALR